MYIMDLLGELEAMATTAVLNKEVAASDIKRWQDLFGYSAERAQKHLEEYRGDLSYRPVSKDHWDLIKDDEELAGFDIEAYSYSLKIGRTKQKPKGSKVVAHNARYIFRLEAPIDSPAVLQKILNSSEPLGVSLAQGENGGTRFVTITAIQRELLLQWINNNHPAFKPTIVRLTKARKELASLSFAPSIGRESTLPHQRADSATFEPLPRQDQYPVYYFFYGRLLEPDLLQRQLDLPQPPIYRPSQIRRTKMRTWQSKYKAVVDGEDDDIVEGGAFLVENMEQEDSLRFFETDMYEVVRCEIEMMDGNSEIVPGLVFRFCGGEEDLREG